MSSTGLLAQAKKLVGAARRSGTCPVCRGNRMIWLVRGSEPPDPRVTVDEVWISCPTCEGSGKVHPS